MAFSNRSPEIALSHGGETVSYTYAFDDGPDEDGADGEDLSDWDNVTIREFCRNSVRALW